MFRRQTVRGARGYGCCISPIKCIPTLWRRSRLGQLAGAAGGQPLLADHPALRNLTAVYELISRTGLTHTRPPFGIDRVMVGNREVEVREEAAAATPFGTLLHFSKDMRRHSRGCCSSRRCRAISPRCCAPRCSTMLPDHDVYITDWHNARDVPLTAGRFGVDEYIDHLINFLEIIGPGRIARGVPALRRGALGRCGDGGGRQPGAAALDDADGRPDRHPHQSDQGQRARHEADRSTGSRAR